MNNGHTVMDLRFTTMQEPTPAFIYDELREFVPLCNSYTPQPLFLREALAKENGVSAEWIFLTNGVDEAIRVAVEGRTNDAHIFTPTEFTTFAQFCDSVTTHFVLENDQYCVPVSRLSGAALIWLANPNNPVGFTDPKTILELARNNPQSLIVIDEIYGEFAPELSILPYVADEPNLAVCKGFSKSYGLAGIRIGYVVARPNILKQFEERTTWANVSYLSCAVATIALQHKQYYHDLRDMVLGRRAGMVKSLEQYGLTVVPSLINTITLGLESEDQAGRFVDALRRHGVAVNRGESDGKVGLDDSYVNFVVGTAEQVSKLSTILPEAVAASQDEG